MKIHDDFNEKGLEVFQKVQSELLKFLDERKVEGYIGITVMLSICGFMLASHKDDEAKIAIDGAIKYLSIFHKESCN